MRLKENYKVVKKCKNDIITTLKSNLADNTEDITVRVVEVTLDNGSKEYLATNVFDESLTSDDFREPYFYR